MQKIIKFIKSISLIPELRVLPGSLAFSLTLSIIPILSFVFMIINLIGYSNSIIISNLNQFLPSGVYELLINYIPTTNLTISNILIIFISFFLASKAADNIIISSNMLYKIEENKFIDRKLKSFKLTLLLILLITITLYILGFGNVLMMLILGNKYYSKVGIIIFSIFKIVKWPICVLCIYIVLNMIYKLAPNKNIITDFYNKGTLVATLGWTTLALFYTVYINFTSYDVIYGGLSSIIILIMWLYFLSYFLIIGIQINSSSIVKNKKK